jgi:hypothetical protein
MIKIFKTLILAIAMILSVNSCKETPLENDPPGKPQSLSDMKSAFIDATNELTPMEMKKDEWALFRIKAKLYTGEFQGLGYKSAQVIGTADGSIMDNGTNYDTKDFNIVVTDYKEPVGNNDPEVDVQKEWDCNFVKPPYYQWYGECTLPPEQNFWTFQGISEPEKPLFFSLARYTQREKLPQKLIDEGRCYNFVNCEIDVNYLEYDMIGKDGNGQEKRVHYVSSYSGQLPYLASNLKTCYTTLIEIPDSHGQPQQHPAQVCQELVNFKPGN